MVYKYIFILFWIFISIFLQSNKSIGESDIQEWKNELCVYLNLIRSGDILYTDRKEEDEGRANVMLLQSAGVYSTNASVPAIFFMWATDRFDKDYTITYWWKKGNRTTRCLVMMLFLCSDDESGKWNSYFRKNIKRLNLKQQKEREEEMLFVLQHKSALAGIIALGMEKSKIDKQNLKYLKTKSVQNKNIGMHLPNYCKHPDISKSDFDG